MNYIELSDRELDRLKNEINKMPKHTTYVALSKKVTSEFGMSVFLHYRTDDFKTIDLTEMDNF